MLIRRDKDMKQMLNILEGLTVVIENLVMSKVIRVDIQQNVVKNYVAYVYMENGKTLRVFDNGQIEMA